MKITWSNKRLRTSLPRKLLSLHIVGDTVSTIDRRAKYLLFRMTSGAIMVIHLGMTGKLSLVPAVEPYARHDHLRLHLDNGMDLRFNDARRFGSILVWPPVESLRLETDFSARTGVEPFGGKFTSAYLQAASRAKTQPVKNFIMDAQIIAGIGNIYANEILFAARIHPQTPVCRITEGEWQKIISATRRILKQAIKAGGSTISDFLGASGNPGYFQVNFRVYRRAAEKCRSCGTDIIKTVLGGRATYFCPGCQARKHDP